MSSGQQSMVRSKAVWSAKASEQLMVDHLECMELLLPLRLDKGSVGRGVVSKGLGVLVGGLV